MNNSASILIAEDSATQAVLLKNDLKDHFAQIDIAKNGQEALQMAEKKPYTFVISDIEMPLMDGYQLCEALKKQHGAKVILLTNLSDPLDVLKGIKCGADNFFTKPYDIKTLLSNMEDLLTSETEPSENFKICYKGVCHPVKTSFTQVMTLLMSTYSSAIDKNRQLHEANIKLNQLTSELKQKNETLEQLNKQKNQFIGMAAHDLRNPLGAILSYSDLMLMKLQDIPANIGKMLSHIRESSNLMLHIINDLLDVSVIESGNISIKKEKVDLIDLIKNNISLNKMLAEKKNIDLQFTTPLQSLSFFTDIKKIEQVLNNLVSNAIKFSQPGTKVEVSLNEEHGEIVLAVKDEGPGIPAEEQDKLFKHFSKTSVRTTAGEASTGLGLAIVKNIITALNGRIWLKSVVGKGSTFYVALSKA